MAKFSTPGQRRKKIIKAALVALVLLSVAAAWFIEGPSQRLAKAAIADPDKAVIQADVLMLEQQEEEYRSRKGRKRTRTNYFVEIAYNHAGNAVQERKQIDSDLFDSLAEGGKVELWAIGPKQQMIRFKDDLLEDASTTPLARSIQTLFYTGIGGVVLGLVLVPLFGREPDGYMPEGFYTDDSWLDIEDRELIAIDEGNLIRFKFDKSLASKLQAAYQNRAPMKALLSLQGKESELIVIPLTDVTGLASRHYLDSCSVLYRVKDPKSGNWAQKALDIEFLNPTVKTHAMERLVSRLNEHASTSKEVTQFSRLKSIVPGGVGVLAGGAGLWFFDHWALLSAFALLAAFAGKSLIARLWSPTVVTEYRVAA